MATMTRAPLRSAARCPSAVRAALTALALLAAGLPGLAQAGSFSANPIRLTLAPGASSTSLTLENTGDDPVTVQASLMAWSQEEGRDVLRPSQDLVVSPPIFKLAPRARQTVRVGVLRAADASRERAYRLFLTEVPAPRTPDQVGVSVSLQLALPLFVQPAAPIERRLQWRARPLEGGRIELSVANAGNGHVQLVSTTLLGEGGAPVAEHPARTYVLPGASASWSIEPSRPWRGEPLRVDAQTSEGTLGGPVAGP